MFVCTCYIYLVTHLWACVSHRKVKDTVHGLGETALDFAGAYYEEHIQPVTASYVEWASNAIIPKISDFIDRRFSTSHLGHMG